MLFGLTVPDVDAVRTMLPAYRVAFFVFPHWHLHYQ